jgi:hypothetical protein
MPEKRQEDTPLVATALTGDVPVHEISVDSDTHSVTVSLTPGEYYQAELPFPGGTCFLIVPASLRASELEDLSTGTPPQFVVTQVSPLRFIVDLVADSPVISAELERSLLEIRRQVQDGEMRLHSSNQAEDVFLKLRASARSSQR